MICPHCRKECRTRADARRHAGNLRRANPGMIWPIDVYRCPKWRKLPRGVGHFHVGHRPRRR